MDTRKPTGDPADTNGTRVLRHFLCPQGRGEFMKIYLFSDSYGVDPMEIDQADVEIWGDDIDSLIHAWIERNGKDNIPCGTLSNEEYCDLVEADGQHIVDEQYYPINGGEYYISAPVRIESEGSQ